MRARIDRRYFLHSGAAAAASLAWSGVSDGAPGEQLPADAEADLIAEPARKVHVVESVDVVVCGGGPAGVAAALAAARTGASVRLIEAHGQLGGVWTTGLLSLIIDAGNKGGVMARIIDLLDAGRELLREPRWDRRGSMIYDPEQMKLVLEQSCVEAGVRVRLHTRVVAAVRDGRRLTHCITESKSGREAFAARVFVDCTGDGDLAALGGCGFDWGRPAEGPGAAEAERVGQTQPFSLMMLVTGIDPRATAEFHDRTNRSAAAAKAALLAEFARAGVEPSYGQPTIFKIHDELYAWMINHEYGRRGIDAQDLTDATLAARSELHALVEALRSRGDPWRDVKIVATAGQIGVREGRRIYGRYTVTADDVCDGARHADAVCRVTVGLDVHSTSKAHSTGIERSAIRGPSRPYDIPLRSLIARDVDGLLMAGRCISGDFLAHSSYRVTGNAVTMGEAAGATAALAARGSGLPHEVPWPEVAACLG